MTFMAALMMHEVASGEGKATMAPAPTARTAPQTRARPPAGSQAPLSPAAGATLTAARLLSPADAAQAAAKDILSIGGDRSKIRFLSLYNFAPSARVEAWRIMSAHVNGLSREPTIVVPEAVAGTGRSLLRINLDDYGWDAATWEKLGIFDPYFHVGLKGVFYERTFNGHHWIRHPTLFDGTWQEVIRDNADGSTTVRLDDGNVVKVKDSAQDVSRAIAPWLSRNQQEAAALAKLAELTQSASPVLRADWFFRHTAIQDSKKAKGKIPGYYDFLRIKNQADYEKALGFDLKLVRTTYPDETAASVARSTVAINNRRLLRFGKIGGGIWWTLDTDANEEKRNYLEVLDTETKSENFLKKFANKDEFTATETFGPLPNGMMLWGLFNNEGERQNEAPPEIANDRKAPGSDTRVHVNMSCIRCHVKGVQPIDDWVRGLVANPLELKVVEYDTFKRLRQLYVSDLGKKILADQKVYEEAIATATNGMTATAFSSAYANFWNRYQETDFDLERISLETGATKEQVLRAIDGITRATGSMDTVLSGLLRALVRGDHERPIRSEHFEQVFSVLQFHLRGAKP